MDLKEFEQIVRNKGYDRVYNDIIELFNRERFLLEYDEAFKDWLNSDEKINLKENKFSFILFQMLKQEVLNNGK